MHWTTSSLASIPPGTEGRLLVQLNLGFAYTSIGDYPDARLHYRAALQLDREGAEEAIKGIAQFAATHSSAKDYMKLGLLLEESGRNSEAAVAFEKVLQLDPALGAAGSELDTIKSADR